MKPGQVRPVAIISTTSIIFPAGQIVSPLEEYKEFASCNEDSSSSPEVLTSQEIPDSQLCREEPTDMDRYFFPSQFWFLVLVCHG